jgi:hypothetical protein
VGARWCTLWQSSTGHYCGRCRGLAACCAAVSEVRVQRCQPEIVSVIPLPSSWLTQSLQSGSPAKAQPRASDTGLAASDTLLYGLVSCCNEPMAPL